MSPTRRTSPATAPSATTAPPGADREARIESVARQLREAIVPVLRAAAGPEPRPMKLARAIAIDKSLASVLVRCVNAAGDRDLLHLVPSPTGLRILAERTAGVAPRAATRRLEEAIESFRALLEATPGGRAALDARLSEGARALGTRRENSSKQAAFKAMSFLLGYYAEAMSSTLFLIPSGDGRMIDAIEIYRRLGVRRMRASTKIPLFNFTAWPDTEVERPGPRLDPLVPDPKGPTPSNILLAEYCTRPMPVVDVVREEEATVVLLPGAPAADGVEGAMDFAWAFRLRNGGPRSPGPGVHALHGYFLHMPTRRVVRDLWIAESIHEGAIPFASWALPATRQHDHPPAEGRQRYYAQIDLAGDFEPLSGTKRPYAIPGFPGHDRLTEDVLARAGHGDTCFRGWRCTLNYPVPLLDMFVWLRHPEAKESR